MTGVGPASVVGSVRSEPVVSSRDVVSTDDFANCFRFLAAGVAVVASSAGDVPFGVTVTSIRSVSSAPPQFAFSLGLDSTTLRSMRRAGSLAVSFLSSGQRAVAESFAGEPGNRFGSTLYDFLPTGEPVIRGAVSWVRGRVHSVLELEAAVLFVVDAVETFDHGRGAPLVHFDRGYL